MNTKGAEAEILIQCTDVEWRSRLVFRRGSSRTDQQMMSAHKVENQLNEQQKASLLQVNVVT